MPIRRRKAFGKRRNIHISRKRKRPMEFDQPHPVQIASPHEGDHDIANEVNIEPVIKRMFLWCYNQLPSVRSSIFLYAASILAPSRRLKMSLKATQTELNAAKEEIKTIAEKLEQLESKMKELTNHPKPILSVPVAPPAPPPPPPPPPPLPISVLKRQLPVFKKSTQSSVRILKKNEANTKQSLRVSLDDILSIKLKKPVSKPLPDKENIKFPSVQPRVTLSDITSVTLRSSQQNKKSVDEESTPKSMFVRRNLRATTVKRSPGGTPIVKRDHTYSTGTGPTPEIERALRRKFRSIRTSPLVEDNAVQSPTSTMTKFY